MARGNHVDGITVLYRFGIAICKPKNEHQTFKHYSKIYISNGGTLIGRWNIYKDYLSNGWKGYTVIRVTDNYIFLTPPTSN